MKEVKGSGLTINSSQKYNTLVQKKSYPINRYTLINSVNYFFLQVIWPGSEVENYRDSI